jgi:hypothetical protein
MFPTEVIFGPPLILPGELARPLKPASFSSGTSWPPHTWQPRTFEKVTECKQPSTLQSACFVYVKEAEMGTIWGPLIQGLLR